MTSRSTQRIAAQQHVDPELLPFLQRIPTVTFHAGILEQIRSAPLAWPVDVETLQHVETRGYRVPGDMRCTGPVPVRYHRPAGVAGALPAILHVHGGGFVSGSAKASDARCRQLAWALQCVVISVDYRLAPETRFPGALNDCLAVFGWMHEQASALRLDPAGIGLMGESAGGGLAAGLALYLRDHGGPLPIFQHLIYPMIDDRTCLQPNSRPGVGEFIWTPESNDYGWTSWLGSEPGNDDVSCYAAAARAVDLAGLPPTFILTGDLDLFCDEDVEYARRLEAAGVPVELHVYQGCFHAFDCAGGADVARRARACSLKALRAAMGAHSGPSQSPLPLTCAVEVRKCSKETCPCPLP
jgi:acetyl esterase/lipase